MSKLYLSPCLWPGCGPPFSHWLSCSHPILTLFPTGLAKVLLCPPGSHISNQFLARRLLIALMMKAASTSETSINFHQIPGTTTQKTVIFMFSAVFHTLLVLMFIYCRYKYIVERYD
jgi:hypothetical protein